MAKKILVVDDQPEIREILLYTLGTAGYEAIEAANGNEALGLIETDFLDLVILDIMMPGMNGFQVLRQLRKTSDIPVFMLSARTDTVDKVESFELGADDYVTKPFTLIELTARVSALLRRTGEKVQNIVEPIFDDGRLLIDFTKRQVFVDGKDAELTKKEYALLQEFVLNAGILLEYQRLLRDVWGAGYKNEKKLVQAMVRRLRCKIEADLENPQYILAVEGVGYRFKKIP
jgi:two-component system, OmpR family, alkaline phosphatase synthesis response regulator PhoP